jgi:hypothetical protein
MEWENMHMTPVKYGTWQYAREYNILLQEEIYTKIKNKVKHKENIRKHMHVNMHD